MQPSTASLKPKYSLTYVAQTNFAHKPFTLRGNTMTNERILYLGAIKFIFQGMLTNVPTGTLTAPQRRMMWSIAKDRANNYARDYLGK